MQCSVHNGDSRRCERRCVLNTEMPMRCDAKILAMRVLAAEILCCARRCDALPRCENASDAMSRCAIQSKCAENRPLGQMSRGCLTVQVLIFISTWVSGHKIKGECCTCLKLAVFQIDFLAFSSFHGQI